MGPFPKSWDFEYILLALDYVSKRVEARATTTKDSKMISEFLKTNVFNRFGVPKVIISNQGTHFCNSVMKKLMETFGFWHKVTIAYHPQANSQTEVSNR